MCSIRIMNSFLCSCVGRHNIGDKVSVLNHRIISDTHLSSRELSIHLKVYGFEMPVSLEWIEHINALQHLIFKLFLNSD